MKFSAKNPCLRVAAKRYVGLKVNTTLKIECSGEENIKP